MERRKPKTPRARRVTIYLAPAAAAALDDYRRRQPYAPSVSAVVARGLDLLLARHERRGRRAPERG